MPRSPKNKLKLIRINHYHKKFPSSPHDRLITIKLIREIPYDIKENTLPKLIFNFSKLNLTREIFYPGKQKTLKPVKKIYQEQDKKPTSQTKIYPNKTNIPKIINETPKHPTLNHPCIKIHNLKIPKKIIIKKESFLMGRKFVNLKEDVIATPELKGNTVRDTSQFSTYTFFIVNNGNIPAKVIVRVSPDNIHWMADGTEISVNSKEMEHLCTNTFARYTQVLYRTDSEETKLIIYFQGQI